MTERNGKGQITATKKTTTATKQKPQPITGLLDFTDVKGKVVRFDGDREDDTLGLSNAYVGKKAMTAASWPTEPKKVRYTLEVVE